MSASRLSLTLGSGHFALPEGAIVVLGARADHDLSALPTGRTTVVTGFKPDHTHFAALGFEVAVTAPEAAAITLVCLTRAKALARGLIAQAMVISSDLVLIDGQKTDGVDSIFKDMRKRAACSSAYSKAHGKLFSVAPSDACADWALPADPQEIDGGFVTRAGVFSADSIDPASRLLAEALPPSLGKQVADLGAGWGYLSAAILARDDVRTLTVVEADHTALECARLNVADPRASFHWEDATNWRAPHKMDTVVMNPPFHTARAAEPALGRQFIVAAAQMLAPNGALWMVANRHLPYEAALGEHFAQVSEEAGDNRFKILHARRPSRQRS